ncbi:MAG: hypothetical protein HY537_18365 [Deltaproteobacteria bacterium]|nr:hypothetical protein [Deltaproteobacteria bacterium]
MKTTTLFCLFVGYTLFAASFKAQTDEVAKKVQQLKAHSKVISALCNRLEIQVPVLQKQIEEEWKDRDIAAKMEEKRQLDEDYEALVPIVGKAANDFYGNQGDIINTEEAIKALEGDFFKTLTNQLQIAKKELTRLNKEKRAQEKRLTDPDNFRSEEEYTAAIKKFFDLKALILQSVSGIAVLRGHLKNSSPPGKEDLEEKVNAMQAKAPELKAEFRKRQAELEAMFDARTKLESELKAYDRKVSSVIWRMPKICDYL